MAVATTARGLLMLRLSPDTAMAAMGATDMAVATDTTARGLLMPSLRLRPRLSPAMAMAATAMVDTVVVMAAMAVATTARGLLMPSLRLMLLLRLSPDTMVATAVDMAAMVLQAWRLWILRQEG